MCACAPRETREYETQAQWMRRSCKLSTCSTSSVSPSPACSYQDTARAFGAPPPRSSGRIWGLQWTASARLEVARVRAATHRSRMLATDPALAGLRIGTIRAPLAKWIPPFTLKAFFLFGPPNLGRKASTA